MKARGAELYRQLHVPDFCREALHGMASRKRDGSSQGTAEVKSRLTQYVFQAHHCWLTQCQLIYVFGTILNEHLHFWRGEINTLYIKGKILKNVIQLSFPQTSVSKLKWVAELLQNALSFLSMVHAFKQGQINAKLERALEDTCLGNHRGQNPDLRTAMQYLLVRLLLYLLVPLTLENYVRACNLGFSRSVKSQGKYPAFNNPKYLQPHKALVNFQPFRRTDPILNIDWGITEHKWLHLITPTRPYSWLG